MRDRRDETGIGWPGITRRSLLQKGGTGLVVVGGAGWLAACGGGNPNSGSSTGGSGATTGGTPKRGGTLRLGASGGGDNDTLDGQNALSNVDFAIAYALFDPLTKVNDKGEVVPVLAESLEPNKDGTEWTIRLRPNIKTHDGKPYEAADVLYSLRRIQEKKYPGAISFGPINLKGAKIMDAQTLRIPFARPYAIFDQGLALAQSVMVPRGFDPKKPNGTGPFKYVSFTPGRETSFARHEEYWDEGKPYLDKLVITNISDETSQINALQSGQVDAVDYLSSKSIEAAKGAGANVIISKTGAWGPLTMRVDRPPFTDVKVRQALRLVVDRKQMLEQVFAGNGGIGNDVWGIFDPAFKGAGLEQREQDIEQAKSLLKQAGQSDLRLELFATPITPGEVESAEVFATQAKEAGVTVKVNKQTTTTFFANTYLKGDFAIDYWPYQPYLVATGQAVVKGAPFSATHQADPGYDKLYQQATSQVDDGKRNEIIAEMLKFDHEKGGNIIPYYFPVIDAVGQQVKGVKSGVTGVALGGFDFANIWMES